MEGLIDSAIGRDAYAGRLSFPAASIESLPDAVRNSLIETAEEELKHGFPYLPLSFYRDFSRPGSRENYEKPYFQKRKLLSDLAVAEAAEGNGRFIQAIEEGIWSMLSEPVWTIPAHNTYTRDAEQLDTPLLSRPILDLFQCETGEILAITISMLGSRLSPAIVSNTEITLRNRILEPYITDHFWWMGNDGPVNNWALWCTQNVLLSVLAIELSDKERTAILRKAVSPLDLYIDSYPDDGGCDEGASYYHAAATALWGCLHIIGESTGKDLSAVFHHPKIKAMAEYIEKVHVKDDTYLNFADCSPRAGHLTAREYLFGKAVGSNLLMQHAAADADRDWREDDNNYSLFYKYIALSHLNEIRGEAKKHRSMEKPSFTVLRNTGIAIYREKDTVFAIKGGNNGESHNHNDAGSIILYKDGCPCLIDIGVETYTKKTFSEARYTLFPMRSTYHNLVNFPPLEQHAGKMFRARILQMDERITSLDLTDAYESRNGLRKYIRTALFDREAGRITITEDFDSDKQAVLSLISTEKPEYSERSIVWSTFRADFNTVSEFSLDAISIMDKRLRKAWPETIYRTLAVLPHTAEWTISFSGGNE